MSSVATLPGAVLEVDRQLTPIARDLDVLLEVTPVDAEEQWHEWTLRRHEPRFRYRSLHVDVEEVRRRVATVDVDRIEDEGLRDLYDRKRREVLSQLQLIERRETPDFVATSLELHGGCDDDLLELATGLLDRLDPDEPDIERASPEDFIARAEEELERYRARLPSFEGTVQLRSDIPSLMVVDRELFVGTDSWLPHHRIDALVQHEVGTHLLTAETGGRQPLRMLEVGTAGYEETQEALGVLSEHLVGGLDGERLRVLAGRALAVRLLVDGARFNDVVEALVATGFRDLPAWTITMRVFRGGGYTKDVIYLRGLVALVEHLASRPIDPLLIGKMHLRDVPRVERLLAEGLLRPAAVRPRWLDAPGAAERLAGIGDRPVSEWLREHPGS
jgi:uncharacterized protein (TIGR02421 family)